MLAFVRAVWMGEGGVGGGGGGGGGGGTVKRCLLILDLKPLRSQVKGEHSIGREFQSLVV